MKDSYEKMTTSLRYWILGKEWFSAHKALEFAAKYHIGTRKDGVTKEFEHQIFQAHMVRTLHKLLMYPEETMCVVFLHDVMEDYNVSYDEIELLFGKRVADAVEKMTKVYKGVKKDMKTYFYAISTCPIASFAKPVDRVHNQKTMDGVFKIEKQEEYINETKEYIIPALKLARRNFPEQELVYENLKLILKQQIALYESMHKLIKKSNS